MGQILKAHAMANLWCEPLQDSQHVFRPPRLTLAGGALKGAPVLRESVPLPNAGNVLDKTRYHVYQIGQLPPEYFGFTINKDEWVSLQTACEANNMVIDLFTQNGTRIPCAFGYIRNNRGTNLIIAIKYMPFFDMAGLNQDSATLYVRFYQNARYTANSWNLALPDPMSGIVHVVRTIQSQNDYTQWTADCQSVIDHYVGSGMAVYQTDGLVTNKPNGFTNDLIGKTLTMFWDESVKAVDFFPLTGLPTFTSDLDINQVKYCVIRQPPYYMIDYHDDVDFYVVNRTSSTVYKGALLGRLRSDVVRMLTHTAYAVRKASVDALIAACTALTGSSTLELMVVVREGGFVRGLSPQSNRIDELYKLSYSDVVEAITGSQTQVPEWKAVNLEKSAYTKVMRSLSDDITDVMVEEAYGYNSAMRVIADPDCAIEVVGSQRFVKAPQSMQTLDSVDNQGKRAVFVYVEGMLTGWFNDIGVYQTIPIVQPNTFGAVDAAEVLNGTVTENQDSVYFDMDVENPALKQYGFRCYATPMVSGIPTENWTDVTDTVYCLYDPEGDAGNGYTPRVQWNWSLLDAGNLYPCVRIADKILFYTAPSLEPDYPGFIRFDVQATFDWLGGTTTRKQSVPFGNVDVFMDGYSLIQGIDYYVDWPTITIVKRPYSLPADTVIQVRCYGLADPDTSANYGPREAGFARGGILSVNGHYDIRNDRNIRIVVAGKRMLRSQVRFAENGTGNLVTDGRAYGITDYVIGVENFTTQRTVPYHEQAVDLDERVMAYLTPRLPAVDPIYPVIIEERHDTVSPFCSAIIHAFENDFLGAGQLTTPYTKAETDAWLASYQSLLEHDPAALNADQRYIMVYPHQYADAMTLTVDQYRFMEFVIANYLNNRVDLTPSIIIG